MQGVGILAAALVTLVLSAIFNAYNLDTDVLWRLVLMFGAIPTTVTMYTRLNLPETLRYTLFVANDQNAFGKDVSSLLRSESPSIGGPGTPEMAPSVPSSPARPRPTYPRETFGGSGS